MPITCAETTAGDALDYIGNKYPDLPLDKSLFLITVNHELVSADRQLHPNDVVCLVPHIGGG
jgi:molybdopterin converting factor small subunit